MNMTSEQDEKGALARAWHAFVRWFWRPSWDAQLPEDPQARYFARKEHNRVVRRRIGFIVLLAIIVLVIVIVRA